jgi:EAL domain-containing protein (putative c-di-GMP-specific phosphodiesterase class I)
LTVVAEGVETSGVHEALKRTGCDVVQGYFIMRPAPIHELVAWIRTQTKE